MKKSIYTYALGALLLTAAGCRKYVEIDQPGKRVLKLTADYDALLNYTFNMNTGYSLPWPYADDMEVTDVVLEQRVTNVSRMAYTWSENLYGDNNDADWDRYYKQIYVCNQISDAIMDSEGGTDAQKRNTLAEAKVYRAAAYLDLVNIYAKHYTEAAAANDPGVPLVLHAQFEGVNLTRASVKAVYAQIIKDLEEAMPYLDNTPLQVTEASKMAAFALLTRAHLYMGAYSEAARFADSTLARNNKLLNLANYVNGQAYPVKLVHPEMLFARTLASTNLVLYPLSPALQALFTPQDLRWQLYTRDGAQTGLSPAFVGRAYFRNRLTNEGIYIGPDVPEVMVTKAECLARTNKPADAVAILNEIRKNRFLPADYQPLTAATADEALRLVLDERRRELLGNGTRLFDQKRLNLEPAFAKTVTRTFLGETYTLAPNANRYVFPIAYKYVRMNPEITQNPR